MRSAVVRGSRAGMLLAAVLALIAVYVFAGRNVAHDKVSVQAVGDTSEYPVLTGENGTKESVQIKAGTEFLQEQITLIDAAIAANCTSAGGTVVTNIAYCKQLWDAREAANAALYDPPKPRYKVRVGSRPVGFSAVHAGHGVNRPAAKAVNVANLAAATVNGLVLSAVLATEKAETARRAHDHKWQKRQEAAASRFYAQAAGKARGLPGLLRAEVRALKASHVHQVFTVADATRFQQSVRDRGLPAKLVSAMRRVGLSSGAISSIKDIIVAANATSLKYVYPDDLASARNLRYVRAIVRTTSWFGRWERKHLPALAPTSGGPGGLGAGGLGF